jgi:hypothetical protein
MTKVHKRCLAAANAISGDFGKVLIKGIGETATQLRVKKIELDIKEILSLNGDQCDLEVIAYLDGEKKSYGYYGIDESNWDFQKIGTKIMAIIFKDSLDSDKHTKVYIVCGGSRSIMDYKSALRTAITYKREPKKSNVMGQIIHVNKFIYRLERELVARKISNYKIVLTGHSLGGYLAVRTALFIGKWKTTEISTREKVHLKKIEYKIEEVVTFNPLPINTEDVHLSVEQKEGKVSNLEITNYVIPKDWLYTASKNTSMRYFGEILNGLDSESLQHPKNKKFSKSVKLISLALILFRYHVLKAFFKKE